jgi:CheY-like chemotaxis protein
VALDRQTQLRRLGYEATIRAGTPREVVTFAQESQPDLIVLDLNIEGDMHGLEVAREIHATATIPIVFVSAFSQDVWENDPVIPKPYRYVTKPFTLPALQVAI